MLLSMLFCPAAHAILVAGSRQPELFELSHFANPPAASRASFRYWLPDATVASSSVVRDIHAVADIGAGGIEFLPFYEYGGELSPPPLGVNWSTYGFGTEPYKEILKDALRAHAERNMLLDFALGPGQGQGVPSNPHDEGLQYDLVPFAEQRSPASHDVIPGWGEGNLIACVAAKILAKENLTAPMPINPLAQGQTSSYLQLTAEEASLLDITDQISPEGMVALPELVPGVGQEIWLFAFYERRTGARNLHFPTNVSNSIFDNGSYVVDHFSAKGAQKVIAFWEHYILDDEMESLLKSYGQNGWEDSMEIISQIMWTPGLPEAFEIHHGYSIRPFLPLILWGNNNTGLHPDQPGSLRIILDSKELTSKYVDDFRFTLQSGYRSYLTTLSEWLHSRLGLSLRTQVSYNLPMEMAFNVPFADVPEVESLGFKNDVDAYRRFTGAAALARRSVVSNELGAVFLSAYQQTIPSLLQQANIAFAAGVNRMIIHGMSFGGNYTGTTWPGHSPFDYFVSELNSRRQPSWQVGMREAMDYLARMQYTQQSGDARFDVAIYHHESATNASFPRLYTSPDLESTGYSYRYIAPDNLNLPGVSVENGVLNPTGAAVSAIVILNETYMTLDAVRTLTRFAKARLPIFIQGEPIMSLSNGNSSLDEIREEFGKFRALPFVQQVDGLGVAHTLASWGISPFAHVRSNHTWLTNHRYDARNDLHFLAVFGSSEESQAELEVAHCGDAYIFDVWTGKITPVLHYQRSVSSGECMLTLPLTLMGNQSTVLCFSTRHFPEIMIPEYHISDMPLAGLKAMSQDAGKSIAIHVTSEAAKLNDCIRICLSAETGVERVVHLESESIAKSFDVTNWRLELEHWESPQNFYDAAAIAQKYNTTHQLTTPLQSWTNLAGASRNASGIGFYHSSFRWPPQGGSAADGAYLKLETIPHAVRILINGQRSVPIDPTNPVLDITPMLRNGSNAIVAIVPSTMWNYLRSLNETLVTAGKAALSSPQLPEKIPLTSLPITENGLLGKIVVEPYKVVVMEKPS